CGCRAPAVATSNFVDWTAMVGSSSPCMGAGRCPQGRSRASWRKRVCPSASWKGCS
ncbi:MAG: hypothetical protein AVDCRST_MAG59-3429, partial [uncultured Thermomicrobiales bacterium]